MRPGVLSAVLVVCLAAAPLASAASPAQNARAAATLRPLVKKKFKQVVPKLVLGKLTCNTPKGGATATCVAHFADRPDGVNVTYTIKAILHDARGSLSWRTTTHSCTLIKTGKKIGC